jgi:hypothetical protein
MAVPPAPDSLKISLITKSPTSECDSLTNRGMLAEFPSRPASPGRRLVVEATFMV